MLKTGFQKGKKFQRNYGQPTLNLFAVSNTEKYFFDKLITSKPLKKRKKAKSMQTQKGALFKDFCFKLKLCFVFKNLK